MISFLRWGSMLISIPFWFIEITWLVMTFSGWKQRFWSNPVYYVFKPNLWLSLQITWDLYYVPGSYDLQKPFQCWHAFQGFQSFLYHRKLLSLHILVHHKLHMPAVHWSNHNSNLSWEIYKQLLARFKFSSSEKWFDHWTKVSSEMEKMSSVNIELHLVFSVCNYLNSLLKTTLQTVRWNERTSDRYGFLT